MTIRTFHVELTVTKWVAVKVEASDFDDEDELQEEIETRALEDFWTPAAWGDDYEYQTVKEVTAKTEAA